MPTFAQEVAKVGGLASQSDIARRMGLSRQRVADLVRQEDFPAPVATVSGCKVWTVSEVDAWFSRRARGVTSVAA